VAIAVGGLMTVLVLAASSVSGDRPVADFYREAAVPEAFGRNIVNVILVDFRAADTLGEITVVAVAAPGVAALMAAARRREKEGRERQPHFANRDPVPGAAADGGIGVDSAAWTQ
jgi:multicomponent Na+:H+ antiporter subunit A